MTFNIQWGCYLHFSVTYQCSCVFYSKIIYTDWLKLATWLATSNLGASFRIRVMTRKFVYAFGSRKCHHLHSWRQLNLWHFKHRQVVPTHNVQHRRLSQWHFYKWRLDRDNDTLEVTSWLMISHDLAFHLCLEFLQQHCYIRDRRSFLWPETLNEQSSGVLFWGGDFSRPLFSLFSSFQYNYYCSW